MDACGDRSGDCGDAGNPLDSSALGSDSDARANGASAAHQDSGGPGHACNAGKQLFIVFHNQFCVKCVLLLYEKLLVSNLRASHRHGIGAEDL